MTTHHTLDTTRHQSRVLSTFLDSRPGGRQRAGVQTPAPRNAATVSSGDRQGMLDLFAPIVSSAGFPVTERTAMQVGTVYACLAKLSGAITQLPLQQYRLDTYGNRERMEPTPLWWLLNESPADAWTAASWWEWIVRCVAFRGDQHTEILRKGAGIAGLKIHHPDNSRARRVDGRLRYDCVDPDTGRVYGVDQDDMLHFAGLGFDGVRSPSIIAYAARQAIGNTLAASDFAGRAMGEGGMPKIAIGYPAEVDEEQITFLHNSFTKTYGQGRGRNLPLVLSEGAEVKQLSISPVDLELMALRKFEKSDIYEAFGVPPIIAGDAEKTTTWGTGIEQIILGFVRFTIKPHIERWEQELNRKLFRRAGQFVAFDLDALTSGDSKTQSEVFRSALGGPGTGDGWMTKNEIRQVKNLPPVPGGNELYLAPAKPGTAAPAPAPAQTPEVTEE